MNWTEIFQRKMYKWPKTHEEMANIHDFGMSFSIFSL
jgi:hypothetical protein